MTIDELRAALNILEGDGDLIEDRQSESFDQWRIKGTMLLGEFRLAKLEQQIRGNLALESIAASLEELSTHPFLERVPDTLESIVKLMKVAGDS